MIFSFIKNISILNIWLLPVALLFAIIALLLYNKRFFKVFNIIKKLSHPSNFKEMFQNFSKTKRFFGYLTFLVALICITACFLRVQYGGKKVSFDQEGRSVLFALDISRSMIAQDVSPSRLELAKIKIRSLISMLDAERFGLIIFSDKAALHCPFVKDQSTFISFLSELDTLSVSSAATTSLSSPFIKAMEIFNRNKCSNKILILITDGEDFSNQTSKIVGKAVSEKIALFTLGIGTEAGAPVPILNGFGETVDFEKDGSGNAVLTKLNVENLEKISKALGGSFCKSTYNDSDLYQIKAFIEKFEKEHFADATFEIKDETYHYFAALAAIFLALEKILI